MYIYTYIHMYIYIYICMYMRNAGLLVFGAQGFGPQKPA